MGGTSSQERGDGVPFVVWRSLSSVTSDDGSPSSRRASNPNLNRTSSSSSLASSTGGNNGGTLTWHFAEPSCYRYDKCPRSVTSLCVWTDPPNCDAELKNAHELIGNIAIVERRGRLHFPDIVRRVLAAGAVGCIFLERTPRTIHSLFDGFHSSGRQSVSLPIVLLSTFHADQFIRDKPMRASIELISGEQAVKHIVPEDFVFAVPVAARAGDVELLKHMLYEDTSGSLREHIPKAIALCDAAENGHVDCLELLHGFGISLDEQKPNGTSALMMACSVGNAEATRALLMLGANVDLEDAHGFTALMVAASNGKSQCLQPLIRKGARIDLSRNRTRGTTALHMAARGGHEQCVSILLKAGADPDVQSPNNTTALMEAARAGHIGCVKILSHAGASLEVTDREGSTAEVLARVSGHVEIEDYLRERAESESVRDHRHRIEEVIASPNSTLEELLELALDTNMPVDILQRELTRDPKGMLWLEQPRIVKEVLRLLTLVRPPPAILDPDYGAYRVQHFCCEIALYYSKRIFTRNGGKDVDLATTAPYFQVLFDFVCTPEQLDPVLLVLFCKVTKHFVLNQHLGAYLLEYFATVDGQSIVSWLIYHMDLDSIRDLLVWLLYAEMSEPALQALSRNGLLEQLFAKLYEWQRVVSYGNGTIAQRDAVDNICIVLDAIICPPAVYVVENVPTFVDSAVDPSLQLITDPYLPMRHNELFKLLLLFFRASHTSFGTLADFGFFELFRQSTQACSIRLREGGALSIVIRLMSVLGYHKRKRDLTGIDSLLPHTKEALLEGLLPRVPKFVQLFHALVVKDEAELREVGHVPAAQKITMLPKGSGLLDLVAFLKHCVLMQDPAMNDALARYDLMPCLLACYDAHPANSLLHHELTDIIRFVLMDPDQKRSATCPLLQSLFLDRCNVLDFVITHYNAQVQYKGHLTTIANSITTLTSTPLYTHGALTLPGIVSQHTDHNTRWHEFEQVLSQQNDREMQPLGQRYAPLCDGCLRLKEHAVEYVANTFNPVEVDENGTPIPRTEEQGAESHNCADIKFTGYLETLFSGPPSQYCRVFTTEDFITGFVYKKDKMHDHIPIPEPTRASAFVQIPVPMPFHALTFTLTLFALCRKCDKLWYCDTLQSPNWSNRMKWVIPSAVRKWYSFGVTEGPGSGAHSLQFSTKGYKNFIVLVDTWGRQEQWLHAMEEAIDGLSTQMLRKIDAASALAFEIDNEVDTNNFDFDRMAQPGGVGTGTPRPSPSRASRYVAGAGAGAAIPSVPLIVQPPQQTISRKRSKTVEAALNTQDQAEEDTPSSTKPAPRSSPSPALRIATTNALRMGAPMPPLPPSKTPPKPTLRTARPRSTADLSHYQADAKRYTDILNQLRLAAPPRVNNAHPSGTTAPAVPLPPKPPRIVTRRTSKDDLAATTKENPMRRRTSVSAGDQDEVMRDTERTSPVKR